MRWWMEFYNEKRGILARYGIDAPLPTAAIQLGWTAVLTEHPTPPRKGWTSRFERAERTGGQDRTGWVLYRIARGNGRGAPDAAPTQPT